MEEFSFKNELVLKYFNEFSSRIASETGIPSDKYHFGKIVLQSLKDDPDFVMQIDGATGESETNGSVLRKSIKCATAFKKLGLKIGDVMVLMAPSHLDLAVPFYAAMFLGITTAAIDRTLAVNDLKDTFNTNRPKIIFCQSQKVEDVQKATGLLELDPMIVTFDKHPETVTLSEIMEKHGEDVPIEDFRAEDFDPEETIGYLVATSGTTGKPKAAIITHKNLASSGIYLCGFAKKIPPTRAKLLVAPLQWLSSLLSYVMSPYYKYTRIQTSIEMTADHTLELIQKYQPTFMIISPTKMTTLVKTAKRENVDLSSFEVIYIGGSAVPTKLIEELRSMVLPNATVLDRHGLSEIGSTTFESDSSPEGSCGTPYAHLQYKLVDLDSGEEITEPYKHGELWLKAPGGIKGYYNNPEANAEVLTEDKWFKTGDMMYRDDRWNFFFVERIKLLLKYRGRKISPVELEGVILQHPGVRDVAVTSIFDEECGDLPVACVVLRPGVEVTAQEIKDLVKEKLTEVKQLEGGVIFMSELPLTSSMKLHRRKLKEIAIARLKEQVPA
ncbi:luciferin 4-monooxygenase-like [Helicoverpa zea]|uniref:luciferin 4-monooxygenase-like n=1 Tax=Helicoverpa zea TaxID=7113 RepID=UPI001F5846D9|nr:luciferin 4-monooxygenase-like [Helicoverpa zea]